MVHFNDLRTQVYLCTCTVARACARESARMYVLLCMLCACACARLRAHVCVRACVRACVRGQRLGRRRVLRLPVVLLLRCAAGADPAVGYVVPGVCAVPPSPMRRCDGRREARA